MEQQFKSNTHHAKKAAAIEGGAVEKKEIKKLVKGVAKTKSKSKIHKITDVFVSEDASNVKSYLVSDILVPMVKKGIMGALDMILNGGHVGYDGSRRSNGARISYGGFFDDARNTRSSGNQTARVRFDYDDIEYPTKGDAEAVLDGMYESLNNYGFVSVADMYDMSDITAPHTANRFGWYKLQGAHTTRSGSGYVIVLPKAVPRN